MAGDAAADALDTLREKPKEGNDAKIQKVAAAAAVVVVVVCGDQCGRRRKRRIERGSSTWRSTTNSVR